ncbi:MAG: hypothetical protein PHH84_02165 [Oscillospiraceae bacterium]|nr:hypothetical protein [Oscillospiraceae bacterium]MDD4413414.1 hypothetical protein [Oscillospiraceae bacterium]
MKQKNKAVFRKAAPGDGGQMLELIESHSSNGALEIVYTRRKDAYQSYLCDCKDAEMTVCVDEENRIKAQMVCLPRRLYIDEKVHTVGYVTGLHKRKNSTVNLPRLFDTALKSSQCRLFFCSVLDGNDGAFHMLNKKRTYMPELHVINKYKTYLISPKAFKRIRHNFTFRRATEKDSERLFNFFHEYGKTHNFFPEISSFSQFHGIDVGNFYLLIHQNGEIAATGALWNQQDFKQYIVKKYGGIYKAASKLRPLLELLHYPSFPKADTAADFAHISFLAAEHDAPAITKIYLSEIAAIARRQYGALCIGAAQNSELNQVLCKIKSVSFNSKICLLDYKTSDVRFDMNKQASFFECGLL